MTDLVIGITKLQYEDLRNALVLFGDNDPERVVGVVKRIVESLVRYNVSKVMDETEKILDDLPDEAELMIPEDKGGLWKRLKELGYFSEKNEKVNK
jgi:hypothetical protein